MIEKAIATTWVLLLAFTTSARADGVQIVHWNGHDVVRVTGVIDDGMPLQIAEALPLADTWAHGAKVMLLESPGGLVTAALEISSVMDDYKVHTVIPDDARCASACASILFVAGDFRTVEPFGLLGQHSCSRAGQMNEDCNERIAEHGVEHGVSHGSIAAFVGYMPPEDMIWFSREDVDGWGISRYPGERESGFTKSEPRVMSMLFGEKPAAQSAWRLDFMGDGFRAFNRPGSDDEREMQLNLFCYEELQGRLFLTMEINGRAEVVEQNSLGVSVETDLFGWSVPSPWITQIDAAALGVTVEVPPQAIIPFLTEVSRMRFRLDLKDPFIPMIGTFYIANSRENLIFAANNCMKGQ